MSFEMIALRPDFDCGPITVVTEGELVISASVGKGGKNIPADVKAIQDALNQVPTVQGGPITGLTVDGIAGVRTIDAISQFQRKNVGFFDGRVDTNNVTLAALRRVIGADGPVQQTPASAPATAPVTAKKKSILKAPKKLKKPDATDMSAMRMVTGLLKQAQRWVFLADVVATRAQEHLRGGPTNVLFQTATKRAFDQCDKFFKLKSVNKSTALAALGFIRETFRKMKIAIEAQIRLDVDPNGLLGFFQVDPSNNNVVNPPEALMFTEYGGFSLRDRNGRPITGSDGFRSDSIFVATKQVLAQALIQTGTVFDNDHTYLILHELAHFVGPPRKSANRIDDFAARHVSITKFDSLNHFQALRNADTYGRFCVDVNPGVKLSGGFNQN